MKTFLTLCRDFKKWEQTCNMIAKPIERKVRKQVFEDKLYRRMMLQARLRFEMLWREFMIDAMYSSGKA